MDIITAIALAFGISSTFMMWTAYRRANRYYKYGRQVIAINQALAIRIGQIVQELRDEGDYWAADYLQEKAEDSKALSKLANEQLSGPRP